MIIDEAAQNLNPNAISELTTYAQWVAWRYGQPRNGKPSKQPINPHTGRLADPTEPDTWGTFTAATDAVERYGCAGIGFVFTSSDPYAGIDLDGCVDPQTGEIAEWATRIIRELDSYSEISPSGTGVKMWVRAEHPGERCSTNHHGGKVEVYDRARYFTFTGQRIGESLTIAERAGELAGVYARVFGPDQTPEAVSGHPRSSESIVELDDRELLDKARSASSGRQFEGLYDRGEVPRQNPQTAKPDHSDAHYTLCRMLAFWTGKNPDRMERLFTASAHGQHPKWKRPAYRRSTIKRAIERTTNAYEPESKRPQVTTRQRIENAARVALTHDWTGRGGDTDRDVYLTLLRFAHKANRLTIDASYRSIADEAGIGRDTATRAMGRLEDKHRLVRKVADGGPRTPARYELRADSIWGHTLIQEHTQDINQTCAYLMYGLRLSQRLRNPYNPPRKRFDKNGRPHPNYTGSPLKRLGKRCGQILDLIHASPTPVLIAELSRITGIRANNLRTRYISRLLAAGLVEGNDSDGYATPENVEELLLRELQDSGCVEAEERQRQRHNRERAVQRVQHLNRRGLEPSRIAQETELPIGQVMEILKIAEPAPTVEDMDAMRERREAIAQASGSPDELQRGSEHFPETFTADADPQHPIGHDYEAVEMVPNLPPKINGVRIHGPECECWICGDDQPEYIPISRAA